MAFESFQLTNVPIVAASNMLLDKIDIVLIPNTYQALGFLTVIDTDPKGKHKGYKHYWGLLPATPTDQDAINIALYGEKWDKHGLYVAYTHHYNKPEIKDNHYER